MINVSNEGSDIKPHILLCSRTQLIEASKTR